MSRSDRPVSDVERVQICITRADGGQLHGHLWWPTVLTSSARGSAQSAPSSPSNNIEGAQGKHADHHSYFAGSNPVAVFVHQFSLMGGRSSLLAGMARLVAQGGIPAVTFDLRGVNSSSGWKTLTGHKETQDVVAACCWCVKELRASSVVIIGSSAGAPIGGSAIDQLPEIRGFISIGYVFGAFASLLFGGHYKNILQSKKPKLFIHGAGDEFTSTATFESYFNQAENPKEMRVIERVGHFEMEGPAFDAYMANEILDFIERHLPAPEAPLLNTDNNDVE